MTGFERLETYVFQLGIHIFKNFTKKFILFVRIFWLTFSSFTYLLSFSVARIAWSVVLGSVMFTFIAEMTDKKGQIETQVWFFSDILISVEDSWLYRENTSDKWYITRKRCITGI